MIEPTLNGWPTDSSSSPTVAWVRRRQDRFSRLTSVGPSCLRPVSVVVTAAPSPASPAAPGIPPGRRPGPPPSPPRPASAAASPSPGCAARPGSAAPPAASRPSQAGSSSCSAALPIRIGGLDQISRKLAGRSGVIGRRRSGRWPGPAGAALPAHSSSARLVHVDRPDRWRPGSAAGQHQRQRPVAAAQVEQVPGRGRRRGGLQQQPGARVEPAGREHPGVGLQLQVHVGQHHVDQAGPVRRPPAAR